MSEDGRRRSRLAQPLVVLASLAVLGQLIGLYRPTGPPSPAWLPYADKVWHILGFFAPVFLILLSRVRYLIEAGPTGGLSGAGRLTGRFVLCVTGGFAVHALLSEVIQHLFYRHRTGEVLDVLADLVGVGLGWVLARRVADRIRPWPRELGQVAR
ncbi:MAG: hypothetical protein H0T91_07670 [Propionibacteriaceae bacterium]|nr:hypothetical protein [Propionibacteriaceae bacterium]